ncbi:hypothetical protein [Nocardioides marinus]|nr:hypothetical protein [Nocardioides marinus]
MSAEELMAAVEPVRRHHRPGEVTVNTVLAAYLRAADLRPQGRTWEVAVEAFRARGDFAWAVEAALKTGDEGHLRPPKSWPDSMLSRPTLTQATPLVGERLSAGPLDWHPQRFEPGAIQGAGAKKLLGTPHVSMEELLVRETAQNSWDARTGDRPVEFVLNLRNLAPEVVSVLRRSVFTGSASGTRIGEALAAPQPRAIEISDRGTVGLGGPVRNDQAIPPGSVTHFIDLIFNIGATKSDMTSGGTYGFGKSVAYMVSEVGAIIVWSRCRTDRGPEDRLIASAIGDVFEMSGSRYTGRHWWGRDVGGRPEPLVGPVAAQMGRNIFAKPFVGDELGTSILILAPELGAPGPDDDAAVLTEAVLANLWPKLLADDTGMVPMDIRIQIDGVDRPIPDPAEHPVLSGAVGCLRAVRSVQAGAEPFPTLFPVEVREIRRYNEVLGHLALTKYPVDPKAAEEEHGRDVTLMRSGAELVVRRLRRAALGEPGFQWAGVFKPVPALDPVFARSEPPAHDDWSPASLQDKKQRSQVKLALQRVQEEADRFLEPHLSARSANASASAAGVGDRLAGLMAGSSGSAPTKARSPGPTGGSRSARATAQLVGSAWAEIGRPGWTRTLVTVRLVGGPPAGSSVDLQIGIGTDGGTERSLDPHYVQDGGWVGLDTNGPIHMAPGERRDYFFDSSDDVAVDVHARVVGGNGAS